MKKRILTIFLTFNILGLLSACFPDCPLEKYYDYDAIIARVGYRKVLANEKLTFGYDIDWANIKYMAEKKTDFNFSNALYATTKCEKGYEGEKYPVIRISVKSDADFNSNFPAGSELNSIIRASSYDSDNKLVEDVLTNLNPARLITYTLKIALKPETFKKHRFTIEIEKSNHEILKATTEEVTFE
ncbi:hypothetical protein D0809_12030 [Flavobacterium circumlabens]|uniref:DUF5034 domain-containing protein n=1 Tax=Flavobacterium circumlabens TaxID=2133765 RepID=A0A4Y7UDL8_9FLAO|nr:hypothetical protein [Flavobacterium circumlabens]TCN59075.1 hypothetical protein EV142_103525 [Flavobacterium circumlabens]TEB44466.1 hypothetical protein D0809_12030 [Flavobacterium circumlabens]